MVRIDSHVQHLLSAVFNFSERLHSYFNVFLLLYKFNIQIKLNRLILSTYKEYKTHFDTSFHPQFRDISQVTTYDHTTSTKDEIITIIINDDPANECNVSFREIGKSLIGVNVMIIIVYTQITLINCILIHGHNVY